MTNPTSDVLSRFLSKTGSTLKGLIKVALQSRRCTVTPSDRHGDKSLIIMGNGPSLSESLDMYPEQFKAIPLMAVNFAANTPVFNKLKPEYYIIADPHFFTSGIDENVNRLYKNIEAVDWNITLFIPCKFFSSVKISNPLVTLRGFNPIGIEGFSAVTHPLFRIGRAMPRPRNVLIPAIMVGIRLGFKDIYLTGADHSWSKTLSVNELNEVLSVQPHFYKDDAKEQKRVDSVYRGIPIYKIMESFSVAFKAYHQINEYASASGTTIYNSTPGSFIDAFPRKSIANL